MSSWDHWVEEALDKLERLQLLRSLRPIYLRNEPQKSTAQDEHQVFDEMQPWDRSSVEVHIPESMLQKWLTDIPSSGTVRNSNTRIFQLCAIFLV